MSQSFRDDRDHAGISAERNTAVNTGERGQGKIADDRTDSVSGENRDSTEELLEAAVRRLYPQLDERECRTTETNLLRYCEIVLRVAEEQGEERAGLTGFQADPSMKERSNVHLKT